MNRGTAALSPCFSKENKDGKEDYSVGVVANMLGAALWMWSGFLCGETSGGVFR